LFCCILGCLLFLICIEFVFSCTVLFVSISQVIGREDRLRNDLYCVGWSVKLYSNSKLTDKHRDRQTYRWCYSVCSYACSTGWKFCSRSTCCNTCISAVLSTLHTHSRTFNGPFSGNFKFWCLRVIWGTVVPESQLPGGNFFAIYILGKKL